MTNEQIIQYLSVHSTDLESVPNAAESERNFRIALKEVIEVLTPKKPNEIHMIPDIIAIGVCSVCGDGCNSDMKFCSNCGQHLDWSDYED